MVVFGSPLYLSNPPVCVLLSYRAVIQLQCDWPPLSCPLTFNTNTHTHAHTHTLSLIWQSTPNIWAHCFVAGLYWFVFVCMQVCAFACGAVSTCDAWTYWQRPCVCCQGSGLGGGVMLAQMWLSGWVAAPTEHWQSGGWVRSRAVLHWIYVAAENLKCHRSRETREKNVSDLRVCAYICTHYNITVL